MMILACNHISKAFLEKPILTDVTFQIEKFEKVALVGINGAGKTTLLRIIMGDLIPDSGTVTRTRDLTVGYLAQIQNVNSENTIREELTSVRQPIIDMENKLTQYEKDMAVEKVQRLLLLLMTITFCRTGSRSSAATAGAEKSTVSSKDSLLMEMLQIRKYQHFQAVRKQESHLENYCSSALIL